MRLFKRVFKTVDEKFADLGFIKKEETKYGVIYERYNEKHDYTQVLHLMYKESGMHIVQSYDKDLLDEQLIGNTCVGLTMYEIKLCFKKMRQLGWRETR